MKTFKCIIEQPMQFIIKVKGNNYSEAVMNLDDKIKNEYKDKKIKCRGLITDYKLKKIEEIK